ncbi:two-component sensor histidine kinase [Labrys miyagiensis]|uniref:histidine kinase n=1 Tax=Labrys miyagiensis TaxID=346912 RepID=A0ABQ6CQ27_9HYPH|nr:ATP-binding protein [Labrys miyagiensis]GLS20804.1 two-component sensor histidine kinase [Labrys miyagiensis]
MREPIIALAVAPVLLVVIFAAGTELMGGTRRVISNADVTAVNIEMAVKTIRAADSPAQAQDIVRALNKAGVPVKEMSRQEIDRDTQALTSDGDIRNLVAKRLPDLPDVQLRHIASPDAAHDIVIVGLDDTRTLAFTLGPDAGALDLRVLMPVVLWAVVAIAPVIILLTIYAGFMITAPLMRFAAAAQSLAPDDGPERPFSEKGAREISMLARALNDMRSRIHTMINDRTRMLRAISHDLRTPLTRLRLRAERSSQPELRDGMLSDISRINDMIEETLTYLRKDVATERLLRADLPSLLETVCADFSNAGFSVSYRGPTRLTYFCKPHGVYRAVANLVDNGTKFATDVVVSLEIVPGGALQIDVSDDGPGLPDELKTRALEPFFKGDSARATDGDAGFGLGLSIVHDIVRDHHGRLSFVDRSPHGLTVRLLLPAQADSTPQSQRSV